MIFTRRFGALRARQTFPSVTVTDTQGRNVETDAPALESQDTSASAAGARSSGDHKHAA
jgi:cytolysin (calcineurin-like family phosphatase)